MSTQQTGIGFWDAKPSQSYRILLREGETWKALCWFSVGKDLSYYQGASFHPSFVRVGKSSGHPTKIRYQDGEEVDISELGNPGKLSMHASGRVHAAGRLSGIAPMRGLVARQQLVLLLFKHPNKRKLVDKPRSTDICLNYLIEEEYPMLGKVSVFPTSAPQPPYVGDLSQIEMGMAHDSRYQVNLAVGYSGMDGPSNLTYHLCLSHGVSGPWPPYD